MAIELPTIQKMVYNKIPFLANNVDNGQLIDEFTAEVFAELYNPFEVAEDDMMDESKYKPLQKSMVSDIVALSFLQRKILINQEGIEGAAATGTKVLIKAKAGDAEAEWEQVKGKDGGRLLAEADTLFKGLLGAAGRKANQMGFSFDMRVDGQWVMDALSQPEQSIFNIPYLDC